jgi:hypothetical protein
MRKILPISRTPFDRGTGRVTDLQVSEKTGCHAVRVDHKFEAAGQVG